MRVLQRVVLFHDSDRRRGSASLPYWCSDTEPADRHRCIRDTATRDHDLGQGNVRNDGAARPFLTNRWTVRSCTDRQRVVSRLTVFGENDARGPPRDRGLEARTLRVMIRMMAVPNERCLTVLLTPVEDRQACCRIAVSEISGWDVHVEIDGRTVALMHCTDWHHVERLCSTYALWAASHTEPPASR